MSTDNRQKILALLTKERELTINAISGHLGMSIPTTSKNVMQLVEEGYARESGYSRVAVGRRPRLIRFQPNSYYSIGIEFKVGRVRIIVVNLDLEIAAQTTILQVNYKNPSALMKMISRTVSKLLSENDIPSERVLGAGFSLPGTTNEETKFLEFAPVLGLRNVDFNDYTDLFPYPIYVENDSNAAALAEYKFGDIKGKENLVFISILIQGIGSGIIFDGKLYKGQRKKAGILGHMTVGFEGRRCDCGLEDCWSMYSSASVLLDEYNQNRTQGVDNLEGFFKRLAEQDQTALEIIRRYVTHMAIAIRNIILTFDPGCIIIGGEIAAFMHLFIDDLKEAVFKDNAFHGIDDVDILPSSLRDDSYILGVALLPIENNLLMEDSLGQKSGVIKTAYR